MNLVNAVFVSDDGGGINVYDINNGSILMHYKCGLILPGCLSILKNDFVFAAEKGPLIYVWQINSQEKLNSVRMACPGTVGSLNVSPDYCYIAVTVEEKLLLWQICSGKLLRTARRHYQSITVLKWSTDASDVITGGNDGLVCVWKLTDLIASSSYSSTQHDEVEPRHVFTDHCVKVTDVHVGNGSYKARIFTASVDKTCRVYDLLSGCQLLCVTFDHQLTSVTCDPLETRVFLGTANGDIKSFSLLHPPRSLDTHFQNNNNNNNNNNNTNSGGNDHGRMTNLIGVGHTDTVNYVRCTSDGNSLISCSIDKTVKIWHIDSGQCVRTISTKGPVTNCLVKLIDRNVTADKFRTNVILKSFQKTYDPECNPNLLEIITEDDLFADQSFDFDEAIETTSSSDLANNDQLLTSLRKELTALKIANKQLYRYAVNNTLATMTEQDDDDEIELEHARSKRKKKSKRNVAVVVTEKSLERGMQWRTEINQKKAKLRRKKRSKKNKQSKVKRNEKKEY